MIEYTEEDLKILKATAKKLTDLVKAAELAPATINQLCALMHQELDVASDRLETNRMTRVLDDIVAEMSRKPEPIPND